MELRRIDAVNNSDLLLEIISAGTLCTYRLCNGNSTIDNSGFLHIKRKNKLFLSYSVCRPESFNENWKHTFAVGRNMYNNQKLVEKHARVKNFGDLSWSNLISKKRRQRCFKKQRDYIF